MITCNKCGAPMEEGSLFCGVCGNKVSPKSQSGSFCPDCGAPVNHGDVFCAGCGHSFAPAQPVQPTYGYNSAPNGPRKNNTPVIVAIVAAAVLVIFLCVALFVALGKDGKGESTPVVPTPTQTVQPVTPAPIPEVSMDTKLNDFISARVPRGDMAVAIIDNVRGHIYSSDNADMKYVAWGWYLPIYLVYTNQSMYSGEIAAGIMSSDAGVCNNSANTAIRSFGGPSAVSDSIRYYFGTDNTTYGRYFGDVNAVSDNYTTPTEAAEFLQHLNKSGRAGMLSYDTQSFGITKPYGTTMYAQVGTENRSTRKELNIFAIVKGSRADYSVAVMTRNSAGIYISELLEFINTEMELRAQ